MNEHDKNEQIDDAVTDDAPTAPVPADSSADAAVDAPAGSPADAPADAPTGSPADGAATEPFFYTGPSESSGAWTGGADRPAASSPYEPTTSVFTGQGSPVWSASTGAPPPPAPPRGARTGTLVLGLILLLCGVGAIAVALGMTIDVQLAFIGVLVLAALLLLLVPLLQRRKDRSAPPR